MSSVFISHASADDEIVRQLIVEPMERHGLSVWYSKDAIRGADDWEERIRHGLKTTDWFLVALSERSVKSPWVRAEVDWALDNRRGKLVPVLIGDCDPQECNLRLRTIQYVDLRENNQSGQLQLLQQWGTASVVSFAQAPPDSHNASTDRSVDEETRQYLPFKIEELLEIRKELRETFLDLKKTVINYPEADVPLPRRIQIRTLQHRIDIIDRILISRGYLEAKYP